MLRVPVIISLLAAAYPAAAETASLCADEIMLKVAENQDRGQKERAQYVYDQHVKVVVRRANGKLIREEVSDLSITPAAKGIQQHEISIRGKYWKNGTYHNFSGEPLPEAGSLDGQIAKSFRHDFTSQDSKDGLSADLFPLTSAEQKALKFELAGETTVAGRQAYRIRFSPADSHDITWAGEALIDKEDLQPVSVYTRLSRKLPLFVRTVLGTDVPGLGFNVGYKRVEKDIWFPLSFGTEFRIHAVFFINRTVSVSMENRNFKQATTDSTIRYQAN